MEIGNCFFFFIPRCLPFLGIFSPLPFLIGLSFDFSEAEVGNESFAAAPFSLFSFFGGGEGAEDEASESESEPEPESDLGNYG